MNLISKICILFIAWTLFGCAGFWLKCLHFAVKMVRVNYDDAKEAQAEFMNYITCGMFNFDKNDDLREKATHVSESLHREPVIITYIKMWISWPRTFPHLDSVLDEGYRYMVEKYGLKESQQKSAS